MGTFEDLFTPESADEVASYIATQIAASKDDSKLLDCDFKLSMGKMLGSPEKANTVFQMDTEPDSSLAHILQALLDTDNEPTPANIALFDLWRKRVCFLLETKYRNVVANNIRKHLLNNADATIFPLSTIKALYFEVIDKPELDWTIVIKKLAPEGVQTTKVAQTIFTECMETGADPNDVIAAKKAEGHPDFKYVDSAYKRKAFYEVSLDLWVDYTPTKPEEK